MPDTSALPAASPPTYPVTRGQEIMAVAMEMASAGASPRDIAARARTSESWARMALRVLRETPDIAQAISDGTIGLANGYRVMHQRRFAQRG
jgi:hypothetical protein